ncbi:hypothetical protein DFH06DRAFT_1140484 [Mycena polygramma]|nr:hypothetical protein DFH06DRAFT_1140484 [Mycena polygramma]
MSLVASRFYTWLARTKPIIFHTVLVRSHPNWTERIQHNLLSNGSFIRILVLDLSFRQGVFRIQPSAAELSCIQQLLEASRLVSHLAVTWNIWALLPKECGALHLESLYLIWDRALPTSAPSLEHLEQPSNLTDLTVYAPPNRSRMMSRQRYGDYFLPRSLTPNLEYVTYAADRPPIPALEWLEVKGVMLVLLREVGHYWENEVKTIQEEYPHFRAICLQYPHHVLTEWVAKAEGQKSLLRHPVDTAASDESL